MDARADPQRPSCRPTSVNAAPRILLLGCDPDARSALVESLHRCLSHIEISSDRFEQAALEEIASAQYAAIVADLTTPQMDGLQFLADIVKLRPATPTLVVVAAADRRLALEAVKAGVYAILQKPVDPDYAAAWLTRAIRSMDAEWRQPRLVSRESPDGTPQPEHGTEATTILESISDGFMAMDAKWRVTYVNAAAERLCKMRREDLLGKPFQTLFPDLVGTALEAEYRRAVDQRVPIELENYYTPWDRWFSIKASPTAMGGLSVYFQDITERKRAEEALRESERMLREAAEAAQVVTWDMDPHTGFVRCKGVAEKVWGIREGPAEAFFSRVHPDDRDMIRQAGVEAIRTGSRYALEYRVEDPAGQIHWIYSRGDVLKDAGGQVLRFVGVSTVITDRKRAEAALRENEERLRLATQTGKIGLWDWDIVANRVSWTDSLYAIHGLKKEGPLTVESFGELVHRDDQARVFDAIERSLRDDAPYEVEFRALTPDGREIWLFTNAIVVRRDGTPVRMLGATVDVTERKRAEESLRRSEEFVRRITDVAPSILYVYDLEEQSNVWGNREMYAGLGYGDEALKAMSGRLLSTLLHPEDWARYQQYAEGLQQLRDNEVAEFEYRVRHADGSWRWLHSRDMAFLRTATGAVKQILGAALDITERKRVEQEREDLIAQLKQSQEALASKVADLELFHDVTVERELKMMELEKELARFKSLHPEQSLRNLDG